MVVEYGNFSETGNKFLINTPATPRHWYNYIWNNNFLSVFSQTGQGSAIMQDEEGNRVNLIKARMVYLVDCETGEFWSVNNMPVNQSFDDYCCIHGMGYSSIELKKNGILAGWRMFVPLAQPCEVWTVKLKNLSRRDRKLKVISCFDTRIQGEHEGTVPAAHAHFDQELQAVVGSNIVRFGSWYSHETVGATEDGFIAMDRPVSGYESRKSAFTGKYGSLTNPDALIINKGCTNSECEFEDIIFALETTISLTIDEELSITVLGGTHKSREDIKKMKNMLLPQGAADEEFSRVCSKIMQDVEGLLIDTPDAEFNLFFNNWLKHQLQFNSTWARVYFNGFRDLCQDTANLSRFNASFAKKQFFKVLKHQYSSGFAPRAWCKGELIDQDYSDSPVWITSSVYNLVNETGDLSILNEMIPFWDGPAASVYEHMKRSLDYLWEDRGSHGLSHIHSGDWNDVMNGVGNKGLGESVWLSMALKTALGQFAELAGLMNEDNDKKTALSREQEMSELIHTHAWDGEWYIRAYTDNGLPVGSKSCDEAKCFLNPQSFAVIAGLTKGEKCAGLMSQTERLLETPIGYTTMETPFTHYREDIGFVSGIRPGENVNAGIYVHANMFRILAECMAGRNDKAWNAIQKLMPYNRIKTGASCEPYVLPNSYFGPSAGYRYGDAGSGWITGSAGWLLTIVTDYIFGLKPKIDGLYLEPCLPSHWQRSSITRFFRGACYKITYHQPEGGSSSCIASIRVDGKEYNSNMLPDQKGSVYNVEVFMS